MTSLPVSRPVLALLLATISAAGVTSLAPTAELPIDDLLPERNPAAAHQRTATTPATDSPAGSGFLRPAVPDSKGKSAAVFGTPAPVAPPIPPPQSAPPPPVEIVVEPPTAPTAPFAYLGRLSQEGGEYIFLQDGTDAIAVVPGSAINSQWQLDRADESELLLRYVPLDKTTTLRIAP